MIPPPPPPQDAVEPAWRAHVKPASDEAERALETLELFEGFRARLFAAEPRLANPVCLYVDRLGEVWVAETFRHFDGVTDMREHTEWLDEDLANRTVDERVGMLRRREGEGFARYGRASERVRWLADTDGDGRADVDAVFAEGFDAPSAGIGAGLLVHGGDVYYTCIPDLWRLGDDDGNHRAERREVLSTGYGVNIALLGHDLHGLRIGPDGKLYFSCGDRGFHVETPDGPLEHAHTGAVLRCDLDGSNLEVFATGLRNPQELVFDEHGNLWTGDNNSDGGDRARWVEVVEGGDSGWRYAYQWLTEPVLRGPWNEEQLWHPRHPGQAAYIVPPIANLASGPSGLCYDPGTGLPPELARHFFLCDFRGDPAYSGIHAFTVEPEAGGAGWVLGPVRRLVWNALPTDVDFGPDGSLYVSDWVGGWNRTGKGRIYRLFDPGALAAGTARRLAEDPVAWSWDELARLLGHADVRLRQAAQLELARRDRGPGSEAREVLWSATRDPGRDPPLRRLHGLWGLGQLRADVRPLADDPDPVLRAQVMRVLGDAAGDDPEWARVLVAALADPEPRVRMHAALALRKRPAPPELDVVTALVELLRRDGDDPVLRHAAVMGLLGHAGGARLEALAGDASVEVRLGAVVALRRLADARVARFLEDSDPLVVAEAARAIHDLPIEDAAPRLAALAGREAPLERAAGRRVLASLHRAHDGPAAGALLDFALRDDQDEGLRLEALDLLTAWAAPPGRDPVTGAWRPLAPVPENAADRLDTLLAERFEGAAAALRAAPEAVQRGWLRLLAARPRAVESPALDPWLAARALDAAAPEPVRVAALELAAARDAVDGELLERALFDPSSGLRAAALEALGDLDGERAFPLIEAAATRGETAERRAAYDLLARSSQAGAAGVLATELERLLLGEVPAGVALELVEAAEERGGEALAQLLERRRAGRDDAPLAPYLDGLYGGDPERGRELFAKSAELQCLRCHSTGGDLDGRAEAGERPAIGPTLAGLGSRSTRLEILASIVDPNRAFANDLRGTLFFLADGGRVEGQLVEETAEVVRVLDAEGELHALDPAAIEARRAGLSAMPEGLGGLIDAREMRDLLEYLGGL